MNLTRTAFVSISVLASVTMGTASATAASQQPEPTRMDAFQTPSGNIACIADDGGAVRCDIGNYSYTPPPKPESCEFDWGMAFIIERGSFPFLCVSDSTFGADLPKPAAGSFVAIGDAVCAVEKRSIDCVINEIDGGLHLEPGAYWTSFEGTE